MEKIKTAAYCRVSTKNANQEMSITEQIRYYTKLMDETPEYLNCGVYADNGVCGRYLRNRDAFIQLMKDCELGKIDMVFCKSIKRFGRSVLDTMCAVTRLQELGIPVVFDVERLNTITDRSNILLTSLAQVAQSEYEEKSEAVKWSVRKRFERGEMIINPNTPLGYKFNEDGKLVVVEEEAKLVRKIYEDYVHGVGCAAIAKKLNAQGKTTAHGKTFLSSTILYILKNEKYKGDVLLQKWIVVGGKKVKNNGCVESYYVENNHEAIVSRELWDRAQEMIAKHRNCDYVKPENRVKDVFRGMVYCGVCGSKMLRIDHGTAGKAVRYGCGVRARSAKECKSENVKRETLADGFIALYNELRGKHKPLKQMYFTADVREQDEVLEKLLEQERVFLQLQARGLMTDMMKAEYNKLINKIITTENLKKDLLNKNATNVQAQSDLRQFNKALAATKEDITALDDNLFTAIVRRVVVNSREEIVYELKSGDNAIVSIEYGYRDKDIIGGIRYESSK